MPRLRRWKTKCPRPIERKPRNYIRVQFRPQPRHGTRRQLPSPEQGHAAATYMEQRMAHFVRCIDGHVFDASSTTICPICGALVAGAAAAKEPTSSTPQAAVVTGSSRYMPLLAAIAVLLFGGGAGALFYVLHRPGPPATATVASSTSNEPDKAASSGTSATQPAAVAPAAAPPSDHVNSGPAPAAAQQAFSAPVPANPAPVRPEQPPSAAANISDTLQTTLDLLRTFVAFRGKQYSDVLSTAAPLISRNNPVAMYFKAGILMNALAGERDLPQARALLRDAAQRGDPASLLFMAQPGTRNRCRQTWTRRKGSTSWLHKGWQTGPIGTLRGWD